MAKYQNGLHLFGTTLTNAGYIFSRWMFEWLTQVVGWTNVDTSDSKWTDVEASGTGGTAGATTAVAYEIDMSSSGRSWTSADTGKLITITGLTTATLDGIYKIVGVKTGDIVGIDIDRGVHVDGLPNGETFDWRLWDETTAYHPPSLSWAVARGAYSHTPSEPNFDILITANNSPASTAFGTPSLAIGPFGTWNNVTHAWADNRNTENVQYTGLLSPAVMRIWAYADDNHAIINWQSSGAYDGPSDGSGTMYIGEMVVPDTVVDTNPGVVCNSYTPQPYDMWKLLGANSTNYERFGANFYGLSRYGLSVRCYAQVPGCVYHAGAYNSTDYPMRRISAWSRRIYRLGIVLECSVPGSEEVRGTLKDAWYGGRNLPYAMPFGSSKEFIHLIGGLSVPWNGSDVHVVV